MDERLADIGVDMAGQRAEPGLDRVHALADAGEAEPVDDPLDRADLLLDPGAVGIGDGDRRGQIAEGDMPANSAAGHEASIDHLVHAQAGRESS